MVSFLIFPMYFHSPKRLASLARRSLRSLFDSAGAGVPRSSPGPVLTPIPLRLKASGSPRVCGGASEASGRASEASCKDILKLVKNTKKTNKYSPKTLLKPPGEPPGVSWGSWELTALLQVGYQWDTLGPKSTLHRKSWETA